MTVAIPGRWRTGAAIVAASLVLSTRCGHAAPPCDLVTIRREVLTALAREATARDFDERQRAITHLLALHERLEAESRSRANPALQPLLRRVFGRLARVGQGLADEVGRSRSTVSRSRVGLDAEPAAGGRQAEAQKLIELIQATVRPESWDVNGGRGSIVYFANGHGLVVRAPADVHDELGGLLRQLR